jgi:hypothetical protein
MECLLHRRAWVSNLVACSLPSILWRVSIVPNDYQAPRSHRMTWSDGVYGIASAYHPHVGGGAELPTAGDEGEL